MGGILEMLLYVLTEVINFILANKILFGAQITKKINRILLGGGLIFGFHLIVYFGVSAEMSYDITMITMLIIPCMIFCERRREYFILYLFIYCLESIVGVASAFARSIVLAKPLEEIINSSREKLICQFIQMFILIVIYICTQPWKRSNARIRYRVLHYIVFNVVALVSIIGIGAIEDLHANGVYVKEAAISGFAISLSDIIMMVAVMLTGIIQQRRLEAENRIYYDEQIALIQKNHYERMIAKDEQLKKFRHDLRGHLAVMKSYLIGGDYKGVLKYLNQIEDANELSTQVVTTGNGIIDAIIESFGQECVDNNISVKVEGIYGTNKAELDMELGVIVYNLIKNAVEACEKVENKAKRYIDIKVGTYNDKKMLRIINSSNGQYRMQGDCLMTTKCDDCYHGYGIQNVKDAVKKCDGEIEYKMDNEFFDVVVMI